MIQLCSLTGRIRIKVVSVLESFGRMALEINICIFSLQIHVTYFSQEREREKQNSEHFYT
jgi:hypothetical protein